MFKLVMFVCFKDLSIIRLQAALTAEGQYRPVIPSTTSIFWNIAMSLLSILVSRPRPHLPRPYIERVLVCEFQ